MNIIIRTKNFEITDAIKTFVENKINSVSHLESRIDEAHVELDRITKHNSGDIFSVSIMLFAPQELLRAEYESTDLYLSIESCLNKIKIQISKYHKKKKSIRRSAKKFKNALKVIPEYFGYAFEELEANIVKRKSLQIIDEISEQEAINQMNRIQHSFFIFRNSATNQLSVIYKRIEGDYGIIEIS